MNGWKRKEMEVMRVSKWMDGFEKSTWVIRLMITESTVWFDEYLAVSCLG